MHHRPGEAVDTNAMFDLCVFGVHLNAELFVNQHHKGDGTRIRLHIQ